MKNINVLLAKKYINSFYEVLSLSIDEKELKALRKNVEKYEDVSYLKQVINDDHPPVPVGQHYAPYSG